jgi:DNA mismatch repair protein MutH
MSLPYNLNNKESILQYANSLVGNTLRDILSNQVINQIESTTINVENKGRFGHKLEKYFFKYEPNNENEPDFPCGLELKVTPLKILQSGRISVKERLVCNIINFNEIVNESFSNSSFIKKNKEILLIRYIDPLNSNISQLDYKIVDVRIHNLLTSEDINQIEEDWNLIVTKIKYGQAHLLSESDTKYLGACTKGANNHSLRHQPFNNIMAMQRAFSFKTTYMRILLNRTPEIYAVWKS